MQDYDSTNPIYLQIMERICCQILRGEYKPGDKLPSWVDAGLEFNVNHNTIARTYLEMGRAEIVCTRRGEGTFVTTDQVVLKKMHENMKRDRLEQFFKEMSEMGYSLEEINQAYLEHLKFLQNAEEHCEKG